MQITVVYMQVQTFMFRACSISKYMHGTYMFHVTCRDLGRFACMLHVRNMQHMLHEHVSSARRLHACYTHVGYVHVTLKHVVLMSLS